MVIISLGSTQTEIYFQKNMELTPIFISERFGA